MSYILDALRRSQAERERGQVPGLGTQLAPPVPNEATAQARPLLWVAVGVAVALLAAVVALWLRQQAQPGSPQVASAPTVAPVATMAAPVAPAASTVVVAPVVVAPPPVEVAPAPVAITPPVPVDVAPAPAARTRPAASAAAAMASPLAASAPSTAAGTLPDAVASAPVNRSAEPPRPVPLAQLSADQRRSFPPLAVSGSVWSDNAASRFVILNGQIVHEGETPAAGVTLERIAPHALILRWREMRIEMPF